MGHEHAFRPLSGAGVFERLARDAQGSSSLGEFRVEMLKVLLRDLGGDSAAVLEPPGKNATRAEIQSRTAALGSSADYEDRYLRDKDRYDRSIPDLMRAIRTSGAVIDTEVYGTRQRARLALYAEVLLPQGTSSILAAAASWRGRPTALIVLKRHGRGTRFGSRESAALLGILPALGLADAGFQYSLQSSPGIARPLSPREAQVGELACKGMTNVEIASVLGTSRETVKKQLRSVFEKAGVTNRTALASRWSRSWLQG